MEEQNKQSPEIQKPIRKEGSVGAMVGSIIVILIILAGGVYFMDSLRNKIVDEDVSSLDETSTTSIETINAELDAIELEELDAEIEAIEAEIDAALAE
jgi:uncharacterized protein HemX